MAAVDAALCDALRLRVQKLERAVYDCPDGENVDESMRRARQAVQMATLYSARWMWVPSAYYTWPLSERAACLQAPSPQYLCKSLLVENKKCRAACHDPTNPRFVLVVIQYAATLDLRKLVSAIRALRPNVKDRLEDSQFEFRIAHPEDNDRLTGYSHNSVTPFGILDASNVSILLCKAIVSLKCFWMGGGHVNLKLGMSVSDFVSAFNPIIAGVSQPRIDLDDSSVAELDR
jgi:prolyl-tRNA editing enzyme YbaK/EbsC (Cys-tRNA(Pro) deacylase)